MMKGKSNGLFTPYYNESNVVLNFQPLVDQRGEIKGYISQVELPENAFRDNEKKVSLYLLQVQLSWLQTSRHLTYNYFIHLPLDIIACDEIFRFLNENHSNGVVLLLQARSYTGMIDSEVRTRLVKNIHALREAGYKIWLNDVDLSRLTDIGSLCIKFDGIKVACQQLTDYTDDPFLLQEMVCFLRLLGSELMVSRINSQGDILQTAIIDADYFTGELWSLRRFWNHHDNHVSLTHHDRKEIRVYHSLTDVFYAEGLLKLLEECAAQIIADMDVAVVFVENEIQADVVFRDCWPGEMPYDSWRATEDLEYRQHLNKCLYAAIYSSFSASGYQSSGKETLPDTIECAFWRGDKLDKIRGVLVSGLQKYVYQSGQGNSPELSGNKRPHRYVFTEIKSLNHQEKYLVRCMGKGLSLSLTARELGCSLSTASSHKQSAMQKLGMSNMREFSMYAWWFCYFQADGSFHRGK
ncbi:LuxR C-terminal-related transcriptional regulator [Citrobacter sp. Cb003]|uniref:helix-turn-helix transcriptional regulator n=1 Tax=Citrobacter sp. Cb003 TaxID=2985005 RepID=UPI00257E5360|nr:LuxR C-terminal-related transcriptional regulator [Citrobacter sp. Cb003]MDM3379281.1 LuxR C-terminal-related transcriptional regulator [Citrobacter sp. Cb003]